MVALLNSKCEFNRCYIPRLAVVEEDVAKQMEHGEKESAKKVEEELRSKDNTWERSKTASRPNKVWSKELLSTREPHKEQRPSKRTLVLSVLR